MAEVDPTASTASPAAGSRTGNGFELRLERGGAHVRLGAPAAIAGLLVEHLDLKVPDIALPFDAGGGPAQFRNRLCDLDALTVRADQGLVSASAARLDLGELGLGTLEVSLRDGFAEVGGRLAGGTAFSMRLGLLPGFERGVAVVPYAPRLYGPSPIPAAALPHLAARALTTLGLPDDPLPLLARRLLVSRGWKVPREGGVRLAAATVAPGGVRLAWTREVAAPPAAPNDPDLLAAVEGARAFAEAEALAAAGDWAGAREAWLASPAPSTHAFAADRLLSLLCLDERYHDEALDLAAGWLQRRPGFAPALAAEAWVRSARGEHGRAAAALVTLAEGSVTAGERLAAVAAAEAVLALPGIDRDLTARAVEAALSARRDHLPALRALRTLARERGDKGAQIRAARRVLAHAPTDLEKARAHAELGELLLESDPPGARLHLDRALRLAPDDADSLFALARACAAAGEHLRAVGALDRLRTLRQRSGDRSGAADLALEAGAIWDERLGHVENALLRYREAAELGPRAAEAHRLAAGCAERLGRWAEAADHHAAALAVLDRSAPGAGALAAAHHLALADVAERHLDDSAGAATHLEAAQATAPLDSAQLSRLAALHRRLGRHAELLHALDRLAPLTAVATSRAALLAEAGDLARGPLGRPDLATSRYAAALQLDPTCRPAIEGLAALAQARGDGPAERDALMKLVPLARDKGEEASVLDRLAAASARAGDLSAAARALGAARRAEPSRERLAAASGLARRSGDVPALAALLAEQAQAAIAAGDRVAAAAAWRERAELLSESDPSLALTALDEARGLHPGDPALVRLEATLAERVGDHHRALGALRTQLASLPADDGALELRAARAALAAGELPAARAHAERAMAAGVREAGDVLVGALEQGGDRAGQVEALSRAGRHLEAASLAERLGDTPAAIRALDQAAGAKETAGEALRQLLRIHAAAGDARATAAVLLAAARRAGGREGAALAWRAFSLTGDAGALDLAAESDPSFAPGRAERAARRAATDAAAALDDAEAALAGDGLDPDRRPELLRLAAELAERAGSRELARRRLAAYCQTGNPTDSELAHLAELHRAANDLDGLATALARRVASAPITEVHLLHLDLARLLARIGREPEAVESWRAVLRFDPVALEPLRAMLVPSSAALLHDGERESLLRTLADHDMASDAERAAAWDALAEVRAGAGDGAGAAEARRSAARHRGDDDEGLERQVQVAMAAGDHRLAARLQLQRARRALAAGEAGAAERLAEAGLALVEAGDVTDGEATLREALGLHPEPERTRGALTALAKLAAERADSPAEAETLAALAPLVPTGQRPDLLIRISQLRAAAGDGAGAFEAAEQARTLAPRTLAAVRQARLAAAAIGDERSVATRLEEEARLDAGEAGPLLLERARLLAKLGQAEAADDAYGESLALLPPDQGLALEQVRLRRGHLPGRPASEPLERFAGRLGDSTAAAKAQAAAAALAWEAGDGGAALRCARRAFGRSRQTPALAGPLLARLLYAQGSFAEALVVHRTLLELGFPGFEESEIVTLSRQLAELASEAQDPALALQAYDRLLALRPQESGAALERFRIDPDRGRAVTALESVANQVRSRASRVELLAAAAEGALSELHDRRLGERLFREARAEASFTPGLELALDRRRVAATRLGELGPEALLGALHDAAEAAMAAGATAAARELLEEAAGEQRRRGMKPGAARDLLELEKLLAAEGEDGAAAVRAREAAELLAEAGDAAAVAVARRALERDPGDPDGLRRLAGIEARFDPAAAEATLRRALAEQPGDPSIESQLLGLLEREGRQGARARLLLDRARRQPDPAARAGLRREAARLLAETGEADDTVLAADTLLAVTTDLPQDFGAIRLAASALVACGRTSEAVRLLAELSRASPDEQALPDQDEQAGGPRRPPPAAPAPEPLEEAFSPPEQPPGPGSEPVAGPRTLEFPALDRRDREPAAAERPVEEPEQPPEPVPAPAFEAIVGPRTLEFPAVRPPPTEELPAAEQAATDPTPLEPAPAGAGARSRDLALLAEAATDPASRAEAWLASAEAARQAGAAVEEVRLAIELARESEPDAPAPWAALADLELAHGDAIAAARAYLAVSIRTEGMAAADAALVAARLFLEQGHTPEAVRAMRAATLGEPASVPPELLQAVEALASGWPEAGAGLLALVAPAGLGVAGRAVHDQLHLMLDWSAGVLEIADLEHGADLDTVPAPEEAAAEEAAPEEEETAGTGFEEFTPEEPGHGERPFDEPAFEPSTEPVLEVQPEPAFPPTEARTSPQPVADAEAAIPDWAWDPADPAPPEAFPPPAVALAEPHFAPPPAEALERALAIARLDPANADALLEVAGLASQLATTAAPFDHDRLAELARLARSIAAFVAPGRASAPEAPPLAIALSEAARDRVALPETVGPLGKLLSMLTPQLEPLFPADLERHGVTAANRLVAPRTPAVREPLEAAAGLLSARAHATFLVDRPGTLIALENTRPPALIVPADFVALPLGARRFLATRALDQLERGGALVGKFAPRDVGILLELACRFAGGRPPSLGLPAARAGAFLSAMAQAVPPVLAARAASLGPPAAEELAGADLEALADALQRTSARVALLATGDPAGAFTALVAAGTAQPLSGAEALRLPLLRELATLALSEPFLDLRVAVVG